MIPWVALATIASSAASAASNRAAQRRANKQNTALYYENATEGIQRRVDDAKAAGVHPLYALGAQLPQFQPFYVGGDGGADYSQLGGAMGDMVNWATAKPDEQKGEVRPLTEAGMIEVPAYVQTEIGGEWQESGTTHLPAGQAIPYLTAHNMKLEGALINEQIAASRQARLNQLGNVNQERRVGDADPVKQGAWEYSPSEVQTSGPLGQHFTAGPMAPGWTMYAFGKDFPVALPSQAASEPLESITESTLLMSAVIEYNVSLHGDKWLLEAQKRFPTIFGRPGTRPSAAPSDVPVY